MQNETGSGAQVVAESRIYKSFGKDDRFTLAGRAAGHRSGPEIQEVPRDYLFYSGGAAPCAGNPINRLASRSFRATMVRSRPAA